MKLGLKMLKNEIAVLDNIKKNSLRNYFKYLRIRLKKSNKNICRHCFRISDISEFSTKSKINLHKICHNTITNKCHKSESGKIRKKKYYHKLGHLYFKTEKRLSKQRQYGRSEKGKEVGRRASKKAYDNKKDDWNYISRKNLRSRIKNGFKSHLLGKRFKTLDLLGCSWENFSKHIEKLFTEGMSFENYGQWHIDHIIPLSSAETSEQMNKLCHYTNLQPLWAIDNLKKGAKII